MKILNVLIKTKFIEFQEHEILVQLQFKEKIIVCHNKTIYVSAVICIPSLPQILFELHFLL